MCILLSSGHTADGALNFTSTEPVPTPRVTQLLPHEDVTQLISDSEALEEDGHNYAPRVEEQLPHEEEDDDVRVLEPPQGPRCAGTTSSRPTTSRRATELIPPNGGRKVGKKQKQEHVTAKMEKYLELRTQQVEEEVAAKARAASEVDDFSIKNCISYVNTIEELSGEEKAEAFDVFKDAQNRQIFMTAEPVSRLIWLRKEMVSTCSFLCPFIQFPVILSDITCFVQLPLLIFDQI
jgi:hypothetical protein